MPSREEPRTPKPDRSALWLEEKNEEVKLPDADVLRERFLKLLPDAEAQQYFVPLILKYAGERVLLSQVPRIVVSAVREYAGSTQDNIRHFLATHAPAILDVLLDDPEARGRAKEFLADALNG
jgi:hypothetical protein